MIYIYIYTLQEIKELTIFILFFKLTHTRVEFESETFHTEELLHVDIHY